MPTTRLLDAAAFHATFGGRMRDVTREQSADAADIWPYVDAVPDADLAPFGIAGADVESVYRTGDDRFEHVLIPTSTNNVFLVVVVDLRAGDVHGHHVLNLNEKYGLPTPPARG
jgi:hypothetical protein